MRPNIFQGSWLSTARRHLISLSRWLRIYSSHHLSFGETPHGCCWSYRHRNHLAACEVMRVTQVFKDSGCDLGLGCC